MERLAAKRKRTSYIVEYKLKVIAWYKENGENKHAMARHLSQVPVGVAGGRRPDTVAGSWRQKEKEKATWGWKTPRNRAEKR